MAAYTPGPCAKKQVRCTIIAPDGRRFVGTNDCLTPQPECPRAPGEDYGKCITICRQPAHAEVMALQAAGDAARGGMARIEGIGHVCNACDAAMTAAGIVSWELVRAQEAGS